MNDGERFIVCQPILFLKEDSKIEGELFIIFELLSLETTPLSYDDGYNGNEK